MTVQQLKDQLDRYYKPDDVLIVAYWERDYFFDHVPKDQWRDVAEYTEEIMDWASAHEDMVHISKEYMRERAEPAACV